MYLKLSRKCARQSDDSLLLLGLGVYVSQHGDVGEVYPELAQQSGHPVEGRRGRSGGINTGKQLP